jgi:hypothetical protein
MNTRQALLLFAVISILTSCQYMRTASVKVIEISGSEVITNPTIVDIHVQEEKVTGKHKGKKSNKEQVKQTALLNALESSNADLLIEPYYVYETSKRKITVTVTGFPGKYKNFRPITDKDIELLKAGRSQNSKVTKLAGSTSKRKRKR